MNGLVRKSIRCVPIVPLVLGPVSGAAIAQEREAGEALHIEDFRYVQLLFHLVQADGFTERDPEIADVVAELRKDFNFRGYRLLSTSIQNVVLERRVHPHRLDGSGTQRIVAGDSVPWELSVDVTAQPSSPTIRVAVSLNSVVPWEIREYSRTDPVERYLKASMTIRDGQKVVLGSTRLSAEEPVLILVVTPRFGPEG